jgi:phenylpropionate dioxygenase-like ring-hydroxylating dioxygenase large terminal subunit
LSTGLSTRETIDYQPIAFTFCSMLKNFWYAVEFSSEVTAQPKLIRIFDRPIVLYRDCQGILHGFDNICPHRGASLALGKVAGDCLVCPYHGWHFAGDGRCVKIPANQPGAAIPKRAIANSYALREQDGFVWLFWGAKELAESREIPQIPQVGDESLRSIHGDFRWNVNYERAIDNGLDFAHAPFVHGAAFGNPEEPEVGNLEISVDQWGAQATVFLKPNGPKGIWKLLARQDRTAQPVETRTGFALPNLTFLEVKLPFGRLVIWTAHVPVDDRTTISKWLNFRSFFRGGWADGDARDRTLKIFLQDQPIVESQTPQYLPDTLDGEVHVAADGLQLKYRELRNLAIAPIGSIPC